MAVARAQRSDCARFTLQREPGPLYQQLAGLISHKIATGDLAPGEWLPPEIELASALGVSRPPLREALKILQAVGVVSVRHGRGIQVTDGSPEDIARRLAPGAPLAPLRLRDLFEMRKTLECQAAAWAAQRASEDSIRSLGELVADMTDLVEGRSRSDSPPPIADLARLDKAFHTQIAQSTGNAALIGLLGNLAGMIEETMRYSLAIPGRPVQSVYDHRRIFRAIARHKPTVAARAMYAHLDSVQRAIFEQRRKGGEASEPPPRAATESLLILTYGQQMSNRAPARTANPLQPRVASHRRSPTGGGRGGSGVSWP